MYHNLEAELKRRNITRKQLAELLGIHISTISNKLNGKTPITFSEVCNIAKKVFKNEYTIEYLFAME